MNPERSVISRRALFRSAGVALAIGSIESPGRAQTAGRMVYASFNAPGTIGPKTYFFTSPLKYRRYDWPTNTLDDGGSMPWYSWRVPPAFSNGLDAATAGGPGYDNYSYFFQGSQYIRYNWGSKNIDFGPVDIGQAWGLPAPFRSHLDAAVTNGKYSYFFNFSSSQYARYDWTTGLVDLHPLTDWMLPSSFGNAFDAAVNGIGQYAGELYFFKNNQYVRYNWGSGQIDQNTLPITVGWPALAGLSDSPIRRVILYVTIEDHDHRLDLGSSTGNHQPNINGLSQIAAGWRANACVYDTWCQWVTLAPSILSDPHTLAIFGAGSFTEWVTAFREPAYQQLLNNWCAQFRTTSVPMAAVCGSHQLVAYAYGGWGALEHMARHGTVPVTIAQESDGVSRIPNPRIGEVGYFANIPSGVSDPVLQGLPTPCYFYESHYDEVVPSAVAAAAVATQLLTPYGLTGADQQYSGSSSALSYPDERSQIQLLRYSTTGNRPFYTSEFHPELFLYFDNSNAMMNAVIDGPQYLSNFLNLAVAYWASGSSSTSIAVSAGVNQSITLPAAAVLSGAASTGSGTGLSVAWSVVSGPGAVTFSSPASLNSTATFSQSGTYVLCLTATSGSSSATSNVTVTVKPAAAQGLAVIRVAAGAQQPYTDSQGNVWSADTGCVDTTSSTWAVTNSIAGTSDPRLYQEERWGKNITTVHYQFAVPNGTFAVTLKFAELYYSGRGQRIFNIIINGQNVLPNFDEFASAGASFTAIDRSFTVVVNNGYIDLQLQPVISNPTICAIQIVQTS